MTMHDSHNVCHPFFESLPRERSIRSLLYYLNRGTAIDALCTWTTDYPNNSNARAVYSWDKLGKSIFRSGHDTIPITGKLFKASFICRNVVLGIRVLTP